MELYSYCLDELNFFIATGKLGFINGEWQLERHRHHGYTYIIGLDPSKEHKLAEWHQEVLTNHYTL